MLSISLFLELGCYKVKGLENLCHLFASIFFNVYYLYIYYLLMNLFMFVIYVCELCTC